MPHYNLCLLGYGNVGRNLVKLLYDKYFDLRDKHDIEFSITGIATRRIGWLASPDGFDYEDLITDKPLVNIDPAPTNVHEWLKAARTDAMFEITSLNPQTGQPAIDHCVAALEHGAHAITANKGTVVHGYHMLRDLARSQGKRFLFESTVADGMPVFSLFRDVLPVARLRQFDGLLNGTTGVILSEIAAGKSMDEAIQSAQALGIAETDPSADIDGWDAAVKVIALATVLMDVPLKLSDVQVEGIRNLTAEQIQAARRDSKPYKLVSRVTRLGGVDEQRIIATVRPEQVPIESAMGAVGPETMLINFQMDVIPNLVIMEDNAGPYTTAYGLLCDFITAVSGVQERQIRQRPTLLDDRL
jgi:homoserine dehydrogenase